MIFIKMQCVAWSISEMQLRCFKSPERAFLIPPPDPLLMGSPSAGSLLPVCRLPGPAVALPWDGDQRGTPACPGQRTSADAFAEISSCLDALDLARIIGAIPDLAKSSFGKAHDIF